MKALLSIVFLFAYFASDTASAASITFEARSAWEASVGAFEIEDFETTAVQGEVCSEVIPMEGCAHDFTFDTSKLSIVIPVGSDGMHQIRDGGLGSVNGSREFYADLHGQILVAGVSYNTIVFPNPISAFAVDLANVFDSNDLCTYPHPQCGSVPQPLSITIAGETFVLDEGTDFFGAASNLPFASVRIAIADPNQGYVVLPALDNISFVVVPEPATSLFVLSGLVILASRRPQKAA